MRVCMFVAWLWQQPPWIGVQQLGTAALMGAMGLPGSGRSVARGCGAGGMHCE